MIVTLPSTLRRARLLAFVVAACCLLVAANLQAGAREESRVRSASRAGLAGDFPAAITTARKVERAPAVDEADRIEAYAALGLGRFDDARAAFRTALKRRPNDWLMRRDLALTLVQLGRRRAARAQMSRALALNPRMKLPAGFER